MENHRLSPRNILFLAICAVLLSFMAAGYRYGFEDMAHYLTFVNHIKDPSLYPNDLLIASYPFHHSCFWNIIALVSSESTLPYIIFMIYLSGALACALFFILYGLRMFKNNFYILILLIFFICYWRVPGGYGLGICGNEMTQTQFALPFLLFSMLLFIRGRFSMAMLLAAIMLPIQGQMSFFFLFSYSLALLPELRRLGWKGVLSIILAVIIPASILLLQSSGMPDDSFSSGQLSLFNSIAHLRLVDNVSALAWPINKWQPLYIMAFTGILGWRLKETQTIEDKRLQRLLPGALILMLLHFIFVESYPIHPIFIQLMLFRSTMVVILVCSAYAAFFIGYLLERKNLLPRVIGVLWLLVITLYRQNAKEWVFILIICTLVIYGYKKSLFHVYPNPRPFFKIVLVCIILFTTFTLVVLPIYKGQIHTTPTRIDISPDWRDVQFWARNNTPKEALFLTPYYMKGFRLLSHRSTIAENKDGGPAFFSIDLCIEWWHRMQEFGLKFGDSLNKSDLEKLYEKLSQSDLERIAHKYGASYMITSRAIHIDLAPLYSNKEFSVYAINKFP